MTVNGLSKGSDMWADRANFNFVGWEGGIFHDHGILSILKKFSH